jgi:hypothetical protein
MTVLAYVLSYLFIGLLCCVLVTYLDVKYDWSNNSYRDRNNSDNFLPIVSFLLWPIAIPIMLIILSGFGLSSFINKLRKLFE